jgi:CheY-like chemotaxis protein
LGFTELMMDSGSSKREKKDYMMAARRNGQMLSALIDDILDLSRVEAGRLEIAKLEFSLSELVSEVISALEPLASKKGLPLNVTKSKDLDQMTGDPIRLKQILVNIVGNAIKFTSHGAIDVRFALDGSSPDRALLNIEVEDTGIGISPQQAAQLFRPFTQADTSSTRKFGGTGLGLVLSQRLARAMGGDLKLQWSIPGGGSNFAVSLPVVAARKVRPIRKAPVSAVAVQQDANLPLAGSRILLVDDSLDNQMLISRILKLLGAEVDLANDGLEGIEKAMSDSFDVILMDLQMPRLGGVEATRLLRAKGYKQPIVALTAHAMQEDRQRCINVGCSDYLTKPVQRSHLVQVIERVAQLKPTGDSPRTSH